MKTAILHREIGDIIYLIDIEYEQSSLESGYAIVTKNVKEKDWQQVDDDEWLSDTGSYLFREGDRIDLKQDELVDLEATFTEGRAGCEKEIKKGTPQISCLLR